MLSLPLWLSFKLSRNARSSGAVRRTGSVIAVLGVAAAVAVMEVTLAIVGGFKSEIVNKLQGFMAPVTITATQTQYNGYQHTAFVPDRVLTQTVCDIAPQATVTGVFTRPAIIKTDRDYVTVMAYGKDNDGDAWFEKGNIKSGSWLGQDTLPPDRELVVSVPTAARLGLEKGSKVTACFIVDGKIKARPMIVSGIYESGFAEYDDRVAYVNASALRKVCGSDSTALTAVELRNVPIDDAPLVATAIQEELLRRSALGNRPVQSYRVSDITREGSNYLTWLDLLDTNVVVIFVLMGLVGMFTVVSSLFILVLDKIWTIRTLRMLGAGSNLIGKTFLFMTMRLVGLGMILGNALAIGFVYWQGSTHALPLDASMYYLDHVPVQWNWTGIVLVNMGTAVLSYLVLIVPARRAARINR